MIEPCVWRQKAYGCKASRIILAPKPLLKVKTETWGFFSRPSSNIIFSDHRRKLVIMDFEHPNFVETYMYAAPLDALSAAV